MQSNKHYTLFLFSLFIGISTLFGQEGKIKPLPIKATQDTIIAPLFPDPVVQDSIAQDSTRQDSLNQKKPLLLDKIKYKAKDSIKLSQRDQKIYLYNEAEIYYQDTELKAGIIIMDYVKNEVYAGRMKDSLGVYSQLPYFKQGSNVVIPDSIRFNFDTQKALIWNSRTEQQAGLGQLGSDAMKVYADITKKENDSVYFLSEGKLTTAKDTVNPDYYIRVRKAKFVPKKKVIAGYSNLYIADVPTPIALPFAYFPLSTGRVAGVLVPTFGNDPNRGYFLQNGGYYLPIGDVADLTLTGDIYTNGSYGFRAQSVYTKRYKFRGNVNFRYENLITSQQGFDDFSQTQIYNIQINHSQDPKSNPNSRFSASVNLGSSSFFQNSLNRINAANRLNNNLSSSISYSKTFPSYPSVNISLTATHNQNTTTSSLSDDVDNIQLTLPTFQGSVERIFPFASQDGIKKGILQNVNFQYNVNAQNSILTNDDDFLTRRMFENARVGARHTIPVSTNFKVAKHFSVTVGGNYEDIWTLRTFELGLDPVNPSSNNEVVLDTINGFDRYNEYGLNASIGTTIYGTFNFGDDKKIQAIRHVMRPSVSYGYAPSFERFYDTYLDFNQEEVLFSRFEGTLNGAPSLNTSSVMSFALQNTLEAKVRDRDSTATEPKKISLLSNFNFAASYNFNADSLRLSPIAVNGATALFKKKMTINFRATLDPYAIDNNGTRINTLNVKNGGGLFRLPFASANIGYSLSSDLFDKKKRKEDEEDDLDYTAASGGRDDNLFGYSNDPNSGDFNNRLNNEDRDGDIENPIYATKIPWDLNLAYVINFTNTNRDPTIGNHTLMFSGNIQLSPRWSIRGNSGYDFVGKGFVNTNLGFQRDLKSFTLRFDWTPFGRFTSWNFFIGIKSSLLKDLKWENRSQPPIIIQ